MMVGIPITQLTLFGFAINNNPKGLPTAVLSADHSEFSRSFIAALQNSEYFCVVKIAKNEAETGQLLALGDMQFLVQVPEDFGRKIARGDRPALLIEADAHRSGRDQQCARRGPDAQ